MPTTFVHSTRFSNETKRREAGQKAAERGRAVATALWAVNANDLFSMFETAHRAVVTMTDQKAGRDD